MANVALTKKLSIDFAEIDRRYQESVRYYRLERNLGQLLRLGVYATAIAYSLNKLVNGQSLNFDLTYAVLATLLSYSWYLTRDKNKYQSTNSGLDLSHLRQLPVGDDYPDIDLEDYLSRELVEIISTARQQQNTFSDIVSKLFSTKVNRILLMRLDLGPDRQTQFLQHYVQRKRDRAELEQVLRLAFELGLEYDFKYVDSRAMLIAILRNESTMLLPSLGINTSHISAILEWFAAKHRRENLWFRVRQNGILTPRSAINASMTSVYAPALERFGEDITFRLQRSIQSNPDSLRYTLRFKELDLLTSMIADTEGLVMIVGASGTGKSTLIDSFGLKLLAEDVPVQIKDKRLVNLNVTKLLGTAKSGNELALQLSHIFAQQEKSGNFIMVIEDLDQLLNLQPDLQRELVELLVAEVKKVDVKLIVTITPENYRKYVQSVPQLAALFEVINISEASAEQSMQILLDEVGNLEKKYKLQITYTAAVQVVQLAPQLNHVKFMPDKGLDMLSEVLRHAKQAGFKLVTGDTVNQYFSSKIGTRAGLAGGKMNASQVGLLLNLEQEFAKYIIGQRQALVKVSKALQRSRAGLGRKNKPQAAFLFYGPTGVGKTELAATIARVYLGNPDLFLRLDMSEYQESSNLDRLLGKQTEGGYQDGVLTQFVFNHPVSLILLDEIDKANPKVLDLFLQILDNATIMDGLQRKVDFTNTIIVATSNIASELIYKLVDSGANERELQEKSFTQLTKYFRVEFLNRFDEVIMFKSLTTLEARDIVQLVLAEEREKLADKGIEAVFTPQLIDQLVAKGFDRRLGARSIRRSVADLVETEVARRIIAGLLKPGDVFSL